MFDRMLGSFLLNDQRSRFQCQKRCIGNEWVHSYTPSRIFYLNSITRTRTNQDTFVEFKQPSKKNDKTRNYFYGNQFCYGRRSSVFVNLTCILRSLQFFRNTSWPSFEYAGISLKSLAFLPSTTKILSRHLILRARSYYIKKQEGSASYCYCSKNLIFHPAITCSKITIETLEQGVKCVQS